MSGIIQKVINKYHYVTESIKNRYPCKIIDVKNLTNFDKTSIIQYQAATAVNIRTSTAQDILDDPLLIEKFHPTDGVKLGFLAFGEILLKNNISIDEARELYLKIMDNMFKDINKT